MSLSRCITCQDVCVQQPHATKRLLPRGERRIIFLPERSSIYQYRPEISAIIVKKKSRTRLLFADPLLYILKTQKMYCAC